MVTYSVAICINEIDSLLIYPVLNQQFVYGCSPLLFTPSFRRRTCSNVPNLLSYLIHLLFGQSFSPPSLPLSALASRIRNRVPETPFTNVRLMRILLLDAARVWTHRKVLTSLTMRAIQGGRADLNAIQSSGSPLPGWMVSVPLSINAEQNYTPKNQESRL